MAVQTYSVVAGDITIPGVDASQIGASTRVSTTHLTTWIEEGASDLTAAMDKHGIDTTSLDEDATAQVQRAIKAYVASEALGALGISGPLYDKTRAPYEEFRGRLMRASTTITAGATRVRHTMDTSASSTGEFNTTTFKF